MGKIGKEVAALVLSIIGLIGVAVTAGVPMWRVTSYIGANIVTGQIVWDGLWMNCVMQSTGQMQCKLESSIMTLTADLQAARALVIISLVVCFVGVAITFYGAKCTGCVKKDSSKAKVVILGGILIIISGILVLIPVCWSAAVTIADFRNPLVITTQKRELGSAIYVGWGSAAVLLIAGIILTTSCPPQEAKYGYPGYPPAQMYPYAGPVTNQAAYAPVYAPPSTYTGTGTYLPGKPYGAPTTYSARQFI